MNSKKVPWLFRDRRAAHFQKLVRAAALRDRRIDLTFRPILWNIVSADHSYTHEDRPDPLDFQFLVDQHYSALFRFAMSLTRSEHDACDLVQETFVTWAAKGNQLQDPTKVKSWLFTTLHRGFLQTQRRVTRFPHLDLDQAETELPGIEPSLVNRLDAQRVVELLGCVDEPYRAAVALCYLEDYSYLEIASILEVPAGTVKSRIARGLGQLKKLVRSAEAVADLHGKEQHES
jgi:RNA polymerase sigma-70 factor (ECF subfamily)